MDDFNDFVDDLEMIDEYEDEIERIPRRYNLGNLEEIQ